MRVMEKKRTTKIVPVRVLCDYCKNVLPVLSKEFRWSHNAWGNDSVDSVERRDVCSDCLLEFFREGVEDLDGYMSSGEICGIPAEYIEKLLAKLNKKDNE